LGDEDGPTRELGHLGAGDVIGRYEVVELVGSGGMGAVYAARDPELDRTIAVKVLHADPRGSQGSSGHGRLLREAKAMAQLSDPHVIAVHDVGVHDGQVFVAMELVDGPTLDVWCAEHRDDWHAILDMFIAAGRGLAAAHRAGLVHRDFKPSNVIVGSDGRPRVLDFGLARIDRYPESQRTESARVDAVRLTLTGAVMGTPLYMSPEQWGGDEVDARSDQFSFCVALYEALYGERPFPATNVAELVHRVSSGKIAAAPPGSGVPTRVRNVIERGLKADPSQRYPSMHALLTALDPRVTKRRRVIVLVGATGAIAIAAAYVLGTSRPDAMRCPDADTLRRGLWDDAGRASVVAAFRDAAPHVARSGETVLPELDRWSAAWAEARADACRATHERGEQSELLLDLRVQCYDLAAARLDAIVDMLATRSDALAVAPTSLASLPDLGVCEDASWLQERRPLPSGEGAMVRVEALTESLARASVLYHAGKIDEAEALAREAVAEAEALDYAPIEAEALFVLGRVLHQRGRPKDAEAMLSRAMTAALAGGDTWTAAESAIEMLDYVGLDGSRPEERARWSTVAEGIIARLGSPRELQGRLAIANATALQEEGNYPDALEAVREALQLYTASYGPEHANTAHAHDQLGVILQAMGRYEDGLEQQERSLAIERKVWGPDHPRVGESLVNLGILQGSLGRVDDCVASLEEALRITEAVYGEHSLELVHALTNLGEARAMQQRHEDTLALNERARAIRERAFGPEHVEVAINLANGAAALVSLRRYDEARERLEHALEIRQRALGEDHPDVALVHFNLGSALAGSEQWTEAVAHDERAHAIWSAKLGAEHPNVGAALVNLGEHRIAAGQREAGLDEMRRGVAIIETALGPDHPDTAAAREQFAAAQ
jgi:tetratricopeptide (TPR) repeat protein